MSRVLSRKQKWPLGLAGFLVLLSLLTRDTAGLWLLCWLAAGYGVVRGLRAVIRLSIWRLRNRLLVTYLFIGLVPVLLIAVLAGLAGLALMSQVAVHLVTAELDERVELLRTIAAEVQQMPAADLRGEVPRLVKVYERQLPELRVRVEERGATFIAPEGAEFPAPTTRPDTTGFVRLSAREHIWALAARPRRTVVVAVPLSHRLLGGLVPNLGAVNLMTGPRARTTETENAANAPTNPDYKMPEQVEGNRVPAPINLFDVQVMGVATLPVTEWNEASTQANLLLAIRSRSLAVANLLFTRSSDTLQGVVLYALLTVSVLFLVVEVVALLIGVSLTRSVTLAVHNLYQGTRRIREGDLRHRIPVRGKDQLAELGYSFNDMTERVQQLLLVAQEKERLQAELEIASEVQTQLYPHHIPRLPGVELTACCRPARMVSGDYYDYQLVGPERVAMALGDVAGKGISAALLMATLQSSVRTQLRNCHPGGPELSTAALVSQLNLQLHANTSPEKYATFYFAVYDERSGALTYTNAGHLPPLLFRDGTATPLDINGMVVGAFDFAEYNCSQLQMQSGDLLVCYTDGITEPENEYGEMFGEERLIELIHKNRHKNEAQLVETITASVLNWTGSGELQDDMTMLLLKRL